MRKLLTYILAAALLAVSCNGEDKLKLEDARGGLQTEDVISPEVSAAAVSEAEMNDAVQALVALGYSASESLRAVRKVKITEEMQTQDVLKQALKYIGL